MLVSVYRNITITIPVLPFDRISVIYIKILEGTGTYTDAENSRVLTDHAQPEGVRLKRRLLITGVATRWDHDLLMQYGCNKKYYFFFFTVEDKDPRIYKNGYLMRV